MVANLAKKVTVTELLTRGETNYNLFRIMREMLLILQRRLRDVKNFKSYLVSYMGFPGGSVIKNMPSIHETWVLFLD